MIPKSHGKCRCSSLPAAFFRRQDTSFSEKCDPPHIRWSKESYIHPKHLTKYHQTRMRTPRARKRGGACKACHSTVVQLPLGKNFMKRMVHIRWLIPAALLTLFLPHPSIAAYWGFQPDTSLAQCLASAPIPVDIFADAASAQATAEADCAGTSGYYWPWTCSDCGSTLGCSDAGDSGCGFGAYACRRGDPSISYRRDYWYPRAGCNTPIPVEMPDPNVEADDKNLGGAGSTGDAGGPGQTPCDDYVCNPVKVATGNKYERAVDISLSAPGIPLQFVRHYNSLTASDGPLGHGWTHSFGLSLQVVHTTPFTRVKVRSADGRGLYFTELYHSNAGETDFYGESGVKDRLTRITSTGRYVLRTKGANLTYLFGSDGTLLQISDPNGNTLTLTYSGGLLAQVSNNFGNSLTFQYSGGRVSSITDPKGQSVTYAYTGSDLTGVSYPDGRSSAYAYSNHNMTDKYDSSNYLIGHWDYDANGRVSNYYRYVDNGAYQEQTAFTYDRSSADQPVTVTRSTGATTYKTAISNGIRVITEIDNCSTCGGITKVFTYAPGLDLASVTVVSGGQSYTTRYAYDAPDNWWTRIGEIVQKTEAQGLPGERTTSYTYTHRTDDPFLLTQSTETKASVVNPSQSKVITAVYDAGGNITSKTETGYAYIDGTATLVSGATSYEYNGSGQLTRIDDPRTDVSDITTFDYYPTRRLRGTTRADSAPSATPWDR